MDEITLKEALLWFLVAMSIPSAITGFIVWKFQRKIEKRDADKEKIAEATARKAEQREKAQEDLMLLMIESNNAAIALGEATARAVQRIPDAHCNGDMHGALAYATQVKHKQKEFLARQGVSAIVGEA